MRKKMLELALHLEQECMAEDQDPAQIRDELEVSFSLVCSCILTCIMAA